MGQPKSRGANLAPPPVSLSKGLYGTPSAGPKTAPHGPHLRSWGCGTDCAPSLARLPFSAPTAPAAVVRAAHVPREQLGDRLKAAFHISAQNPASYQDLLTAMKETLPVGPFLYPEDLLTDSKERDIAAELIRQVILETLYEEVLPMLSTGSRATLLPIVVGHWSFWSAVGAQLLMIVGVVMRVAVRVVVRAVVGVVLFLWARTSG